VADRGRHGNGVGGGQDGGGSRGTFTNCLVVEENRSSPSRLVRTTYAPGTGPIAIDMLVHDDATDAYEPTLRARLRGVTAPARTR
jgi:hypothetical protein